jgi:hypothetical protein
MSDLQLPPWFWPSVECLGDDKSAMWQQFQAMPREQLLDFIRQYDRARSCIHPWHRGGLVLDFRDDPAGHGDVFAAWVVSRGQKLWDEVRRDPEAFPRAVYQFESVADNFMGRRPDLIATAVYSDRFGEDVLFVPYQPGV